MEQILAYRASKPDVEPSIRKLPERGPPMPLGTMSPTPPAPVVPRSERARPRLEQLSQARHKVTLAVGQVFRVPPEGLLLGRSADADVRVASNGVARKHVRIRYDDSGELIAEDLRSTNGTKPNGVEQKHFRLRLGDVLTPAGFFVFEIIETDRAPSTEVTFRA